jgi:hypothetical protein
MPFLKQFLKVQKPPADDFEKCLEQRQGAVGAAICAAKKSS